MSRKRKILLFVTVGIIAICYAFAFYSIVNHTATPQKNIPVKTGYREFDDIANEVENSLSNENK